METISSSLQAARSALLSAGKAVYRGAGSTASSAASCVASPFLWVGRKIGWLSSATTSAASIARASIASSNVQARPNPNAGPITTAVVVEPPPPRTSLKEFVCHEAVAIALANNPPRNMPSEAIAVLIDAIKCFNLSEQPGLAKNHPDLYNRYKNRAVALTKDAISKCPIDVQSDINGILLLLETQHDVLNEQMSQGTEEEIDPQEILRNLKAELSKTAQASLTPQGT